MPPNQRLKLPGAHKQGRVAQRVLRPQVKRDPLRGPTPYLSTPLRARLTTVLNPPCVR